MTNSKPVAATPFLLAGQLTLVLALVGAPAGARADTAADTPVYMKDFDAFKGKTLEQKVQELADREEIRDLIATYAHRVAHGAPFADLFTEDGAYINNKGETRGRKNIEAYFARGREAMTDTPLPMIHNEVIRISGNEATGICSNELRITEKGTSIIASGYYEDKYRRENGRWRFAQRKITWFHWVPLKEGWAKPAQPK
jgi:uncharacterized protein (TIGR02246 family)